MHLPLVLLIAVCITAPFAQAVIVVESVDIPAVKLAPANITTTSNVTEVSVSAEKPADGEDSKEEAHADKPYDHDHHEHHEHEATVTVDLHNVVDLIKQLTEASEKRIIAAVNHENSSPAPPAKSYRTADRKDKKDEKKKKPKKDEKKKDKEDSDED